MWIRTSEQAREVNSVHVPLNDADDGFQQMQPAAVGVAASGTGRGVRVSVQKSQLCCLIAVETSQLCNGGNKSKLSKYRVMSTKCMLYVVRYSKDFRVTAAGSIRVHVLRALPSELFTKSGRKCWTNGFQWISLNLWRTN